MAKEPITFEYRGRTWRKEGDGHVVLDNPNEERLAAAYLESNGTWTASASSGIGTYHKRFNKTRQEALDYCCDCLAEGEVQP